LPDEAYAKRLKVEGGPDLIKPPRWSNAVQNPAIEAYPNPENAGRLNKVMVEGVMRSPKANMKGKADAPHNRWLSSPASEERQ
jgi:hypothetical protein